MAAQYQKPLENDCNNGRCRTIRNWFRFSLFFFHLHPKLMKFAREKNLLYILTALVKWYTNTITTNNNNVNNCYYLKLFIQRALIVWLYFICLCCRKWLYAANIKLPIFIYICHSFPRIRSETMKKIRSFTILSEWKIPSA